MNPIVAAINRHDKDMLQLVLEQIPLMLIKNPNLSVRGFKIIDAVHAAAGASYSEGVAMIFGLLRACCLRGLESTYNRIVAEFAEGPRKDLAIIQTLLEHCPCEWAVNPAILSRAIHFKDMELVKMLLPHTEVNEGTRVTLPLNRAIYWGNTATIEAVLDAGGDVNFTNYTNKKNESCTDLERKCPLDWAIRRNLEVVRLLLDRGAIAPPVERWFWVEATRYEALRSVRIAQTGEVVPT
jgi:hypothetical protein